VIPKGCRHQPRVYIWTSITRKKVSYKCLPKASMFSDAQKAFILKQGSDGVPVVEICRNTHLAADRDAPAEPSRGGLKI
jgi:hypothetical protein